MFSPVFMYKIAIQHSINQCHLCTQLLSPYLLVTAHHCTMNCCICCYSHNGSAEEGDNMGAEQLTANASSCGSHWWSRHKTKLHCWIRVRKV